jgi:Spy/CpxP family protein refolding chaperone
MLALAAAIALPLTVSAQESPAPQASGAPGAMHVAMHKGGWQGHPGGHHGHRGHHHRHFHGNPMFRELGLTDAQKAKIHAFAETAHKADFAVIRANRQKFHTEFLSVLTPAQRQKVQAWEAKMKARRADWKKNHGSMKDHGSM